MKGYFRAACTAYSTTRLWYSLRWYILLLVTTAHSFAHNSEERHVITGRYHLCPGCRSAFNHECWLVVISSYVKMKALPPCPTCGCYWPLNKRSQSKKKEKPAREKLLKMIRRRDDIDMMTEFSTAAFGSVWPVLFRFPSLTLLFIRRLFRCNLRS